MRYKVFAAAAMLTATATFALAEEYATREQAVALVKKAVALIKSDGAEKANAQFSDAGGKFVDRDLNIAVPTTDGTTLAHGVNPKLIGKNLIAVPDVDGKLFVKEMIDKAKTDAAFSLGAGSRDFAIR